MIALCVCNWKT